jgi:hypothetical protein
MKKLLVSCLGAVLLVLLVPSVAFAAPNARAAHVAQCATTCGGACVAQCAQAGVQGVSVCAQAGAPCAGTVCTMN